MFACVCTLRWIGFSEDDGKQIAEGANMAAKPRYW
jgi:hypothetical protein